jgi:hypothetical protein
VDGFDGHEVRVAQFTVYGNHPVEHAGYMPSYLKNTQPVMANVGIRTGRL